MKHLRIRISNLRNGQGQFNMTDVEEDSSADSGMWNGNDERIEFCYKSVDL